MRTILRIVSVQGNSVVVEVSEPDGTVRMMNLAVGDSLTVDYSKIILS